MHGDFFLLDYGPASSCSIQWRQHHSLLAHLSSVRSMAAVPCHTCVDSSVQAGAFSSTKSQSAPCADKMCFSDETCAKSAENHDYGCNVCRTDCVRDVLLFSGGGRAQIEAWKLRLMGSCSSLCRKFQDSDHLLDEDGSVQKGDKCDHTQVQSKLVVEGDGSLFCLYDESSRHFQQACEACNGRWMSCPEWQISAENCEDVLGHPGSESSKSLSRCEAYSKFEHLGSYFLGRPAGGGHQRMSKVCYSATDPETRVMCLSAVSAVSLHCRLPPSWYVLAVAGSDGFVR